MVPVQFVKINPLATIPTFSTEGSAGFDFYAVEAVVLQPFDVVKVDLGLKCQIPSGYELQIRSRSSLGCQGVSLPHGIGTVDSDYRGPLSVPLIYITDDTLTAYRIDVGDRIAQGVLIKLPKVNIQEVTEDALTKTSRGDGGFGSTGR